MKVQLLTGSRRGQTIELPEGDAKKLIKKGAAKSLEIKKIKDKK